MEAQKNYTGLILNGLLIGGVFIIGKKLLTTFGVIESATEQAQNKTIEDTSKASSESAAPVVSIKELLPNKPALAWNPNYWQKLNLDNAKAYAMHLTKSKDLSLQYKFSTKQYKQFAKDIYDAKGTIKDDDDAVISTIRNLETQMQLSLLSNAFGSYYKKDLLNYIKGFMDKENAAQVLEIANNFPKYYLFK